MHLRYRYRIYPNKNQREALARMFGCARVVFNDAVNAHRRADEAGIRCDSWNELSKRLITNAKHAPERAWLAGAVQSVLQQSLRDCRRAFDNYYRGKRDGRRIGYPRYRTAKDQRQALRYVGESYRVLRNGRLRLSKVGDLSVVWSRDLPGEPSSVTVIRSAGGSYYASFVVDTPTTPLPRVVDPAGGDRWVGLDLGLTHFVVDNCGRKVENPRFLRRSAARVAAAHRAMSRKVPNSGRREKARKRLAQRMARVADQRHDWLHKLSTQYVRENQVIVLEDLAVGALGRTRMAKSVHDAGWALFRRLIQGKAGRYGRQVVIIDRFAPSSQVCSDCGARDGKKPLNIRVWTCRCGSVHDRDVNAARNILAWGRQESLNAHGGLVRPSSDSASLCEVGGRDSGTSKEGTHQAPPIEATTPRDQGI